MKILIVLSLLAATLTSQASDRYLIKSLQTRVEAQAKPKDRYKAECPYCCTTQIEVPKSISNSGSHSGTSVIDGKEVQGMWLSRFATFKCVNKKCRKLFTLETDQDFVPAPKKATKVTKHHVPPPPVPK